MYRHGRLFNYSHGGHHHRRGSYGSKKGKGRHKSLNSSGGNAQDLSSALMTPPNSFGLVEPEIYRSALFYANHFRFIESLKLKTCLFLSFEALPRNVAKFLEEKNVTTFHIAPAGDGLEVLMSPGSLANTCSTQSTFSTFSSENRWSISSEVCDTAPSTGATAGVETRLEAGNSADATPVTNLLPTSEVCKDSNKRTAPTESSFPTAVSQVENSEIWPDTLAPFGNAAGSSYLKQIRDSRSKWRPLSEEVIKESLDILLNPANLPCLVCCAGGIQETGTLVGCLRKLEKWNFNSIVLEYRSFAGSKSKFINEQMIELFDIDLVNVPDSPSWFHTSA